MVVNTQTVGTVSAGASRQRTGTSCRHTGAKWALVVGLLLGAWGVAHAKTCVWTGAQAVDNFLYTSNPANWQDGQIPAEGDTVIISTTSGKTIIWTFAFPLENFVFTNTVGGVITANAGCKIRVTGRASEMVSAQALYLYAPIEVDAGAQFALRSEKGSILFDSGNKLFGTGEILVTGTDSLNLRPNPNFHGTWNVCAPIWIAGTTGGVTSLPFGADDCTVNVYGTNADAATQSGKLNFGGAADVAGTVNLFGTTSVEVSPASSEEDALVTFRGNVTYTASAGANVMNLSCSIASANRRSGYVFLGDCVCASGNRARMNIYTYSLAGTYYLDIRGRFCPTVADNAPPVVSLMGSTSQARAEVRLNGPVSGGHIWKLVPRSRQAYHLLAADILPKGAIMVGFDAGTSEDVSLDLHGHDQAVAAIQFYGNGPHDFVVTSSERPATLRVGNNEGLVHPMPRLNGLLSVYGYNIGANYGNAGLQFANEGDTSGWIGTEKNTLTFTSAAKYPNLGGIECTGAGSVVIESGATFNPGMSLDVHDMTTGLGLRLATGANLTVKHAFVEGVDLPAGVYCRTGAGVADATEVDWLKAGPNEAADATCGTVTVTDHDPVWIWTGKGASASFADPANWGANAAPDLTNPKLTLNFKNAAGKSDVVVPLDGVVAPAGSVNCGDYSKGAVTFGGTGTLVLGGTDDALKAVFTESASLTWNGTGTLRLAGKSTSTGTLTVKSGTVVLESASWTGAIIVADGAELAVDATCGSEVFGPLSEGESVCTIALSGKLTLGDGVAAAAKGLFIDGQPIRHGTTYGSSASAAKRTDDAHFGGTGTVVSWTHGGTLLIIR